MVCTFCLARLNSSPENNEENMKYTSLRIALLGLVVLAGCQSSPQETQMSRYRLEINDGIGQAFVATEPKAPDAAPAKEHYVSPDGKLSNDGSLEQPWDLKTALSHPKAINPGDTIWLRKGTYHGSFTSELIGHKGAPIIVRQYPGERATLDGCLTPPSYEATLMVKGEYTWFWGFEVTNCDPKRETAQTGPDPTDIFRGTGVDVRGNDVKLINLVIHDTGGGIGAWTTAKRAEMSGNIVYYNGFEGGDRGHGHGIYVQNEEGPKHLYDNVVFHQFGSGIHAYAEQGSVLTLDFEGNILFSNGSLSVRSGLSRNILIGGHKLAEGLTLINNSTYYPLSAGGANAVGYNGGCDHVTLQDNYFAGPDAMTITQCTGLKITGNTFAGSRPVGFTAFDFPENVFSLTPSVQYSKVRPDRWEPGRGVLAVYNWERKSRLRVDVSAIGWTPGQKYVLRNMEDYFGEVIHGVYDGESLEVPMTGWKIASPVGWKAPQSSLPEFGAFSLEMDYGTAQSSSSK
jgi:hypothetical protein